MTSTNQRSSTGNRSGASRKLLSRKAAEAGVTDSGAEALEQSFPAQEADEQQAAAPEAALPEAVETPPEAPADEQQAAATQTAEHAATWSSEDEAALQALMSRRKAAGFRGRGRDVSGQVIRAGAITPNDNTIVSVIVGLVAERGEVRRTDLIDAMASATFPHPKAQPSSKAWCQGYVAGAIRSGFLAVAVEDPAASAEAG